MASAESVDLAHEKIQKTHPVRDVRSREGLQEK